jgi:pectinesterase
MEKSVTLEAGGKIRAFPSIQAAVDASGEGALIRIGPGEYREKIFIDKPNIRLEGAGRDLSFIRWDDAGEKPWRIRPRGQAGETGPSWAAEPWALRPGSTSTFRSWTAFFGGPGFSASGLTIENDAGRGPGIGQAIAAYVDSPDARFSDCAFLGHQDTLFLGPLPPEPRIPGSFVGPGEDRPRGRKVHAFEDCLVAGDVDFIFGSAEALFLRCEIRSLRLGPGEAGYLSAASSPEGAGRGFVFSGCELSGEAEEGSVFLGRPWRPFAQAAFLGCRMGPHIAPAGFSDWEGGAERDMVRYVEGGSTGPGAADGRRSPWARILSGAGLGAFAASALDAFTARRP